MAFANVPWITAEAYREGSTTFESIPDPDRFYLVMVGREAARREKIPLDFRTFRRLIRALQYTGAEPAKVKDALENFSAIVTQFLKLEKIPRANDDDQVPSLVQLDLVLEAAELHGLPFELCRGEGGQYLLECNPSVVITRRKRGTAAHVRVSESSKAPRVLYAWASPPGLDPVPKGENQDALLTALKPWIEPLKAVPGGGDYSKVLTILPKATLSSLAAVCEQATNDKDKKPYSHVHILAHGEKVASDDPLEERPGIALHSEDGTSHVITPDELTSALKPLLGYADVITLAVCYGGSGAESWLPEGSCSFALHQSGFPVVVGSQWPLTFEGSAVMTRTLYTEILNGVDVREALHATRTTLKANEATHLDWASVVAYVDLPSDYHRHLAAKRLRPALAALDTASRWADSVAEQQAAPPAVYDRINQELLLRQKHLEEILPASAAEVADSVENFGLIGSSHKRRAEFLFTWHRDEGIPQAERPDAAACLEELSAAYTWYGRGFAKHRNSHWLAAQTLALEYVLFGKLKQPFMLDFTLQLTTEAAEDPTDVWALGTMAELEMLKSEGSHSEAAEGALVKMKESKEEYAIHVTKRQLRRYVHWWTPANGFFGGQAGREREAARLLGVLE